MNSLGTISVYSAYTSPIGSVYDTNPVSKINEKQETVAATSSSMNDDINDEAIISDEAKNLWAKDLLTKGQMSNASTDTKTTTEAKTTTDTQNKNKSPKNEVVNKKELTAEQQQEVQKLKLIDAEVKAHEQAHLAAAAGISASAPSYTYQEGPDGKKYAVGGEVSVSFSKGNNPEENISKAETMRAAALAPADPSSQDMAVAQQAEQIIAEAQQQIAQQKQEEASKSNSETQSNEPTDKIAGTKQNPTEKTDLTEKKTEEPALAYGNKKSDIDDGTKITRDSENKNETIIAYGAKKSDETDNEPDKTIKKSSLIS